MENRILGADASGKPLPGESIATAVMKRRMAGKRRAFTLVEVIVVLVILAILVAIAIPALTGYIEKAEDKRYISEARNYLVACRTVLTDAYADGSITSSPAAVAYVQTGQTGYANGKQKLWFVQNILPDCRERAAALLGQEYPAIAEPGSWGMNLLGPPGDESTSQNADGFVVDIFPEGSAKGKPVIGITYRMKRMEVDSSKNFFWHISSRGEYDPNAGFEVYRLTM